MNRLLLALTAVVVVSPAAIAEQVWGNFEWHGHGVRRLEEARWDTHIKALEDETIYFGIPAAYDLKRTLYPAPGQDTCIWGDKRCVAESKPVDSSPMAYGYTYNFNGGMQ